MQVFIGPLDVAMLPTNHDFLISNPGLGGSDLRDLQLAQELECAGFDVVRFGGAEAGPEDPEVTWVASIEALKLCNSADIVITRSSALPLVTKLVGHAKIIVVSHHPHDSKLRYARNPAVRAVVNVGTYQFWSNWRTRGKNHFIRGYCPPPSHDPLLALKEKRNAFGHLSSLHPSKGFLTVAKAWALYVRRNPEKPKTLDVVGGLSLYGLSNLDAEIPTAPSYANKIRKALKNSEPPRTVNFHGVQLNGGQRFFSSWFAAILNPWGVGESDPLSFHECLANGVPVVSGGFFGAYDLMKNFPELRAASPRSIVKKIEKLQNDPKFRDEMVARALETAQRDFEANPIATSQWVQLLSSVISGASVENSKPPRPQVLLTSTLFAGFAWELAWSAVTTVRGSFSWIKSRLGV